MKRFRDDAELVDELVALRRQPAPRFAAELDRRVAEGFADHRNARRRAARALMTRLRELPPRRLLLPAGATALAAVVVATALVAGREAGEPGPSPAPLGTERGASGQAVPPRGAAGAAAPAEGGAALDLGAAPPPAGGGGRAVERSAQIVLAAPAAEVADRAERVFEAVHAHNGIVLGSTIREGSEAGAEFDLLIPAPRLADAMAAFSSIADVRSRQEGTRDVSAATVGVAGLLRDSRARIEGLLEQLASATTSAEREALEAELRGERRRLSLLRSRLSELRRRAAFARVSLRVEGGSATAGGAWGPGEALGDAGRILGIAAGVGLVGLAVVGPLALLALLVAAARRTWLRRARARALG